MSLLLCIYVHTTFTQTHICEKRIQSHSSQMFMCITIGKVVKAISSFMVALYVYMTSHDVTTMTTWSYGYSVNFCEE